MEKHENPAGMPRKEKTTDEHARCEHCPAKTGKYATLEKCGHCPHYEKCCKERDDWLRAMMLASSF